MALTNRGVRVDQVPGEAKRFVWNLGPTRWGWEQHPNRRLFRGAVDLSQYIDWHHFLCLDDAVLFSLGYEAALPVPNGKERKPK